MSHGELTAASWMKDPIKLFLIRALEIQPHILSVLYINSSVLGRLTNILSNILWGSSSCELNFGPFESSPTLGISM